MANLSPEYKKLQEMYRDYMCELYSDRRMKLLAEMCNYYFNQILPHSMVLRSGKRVNKYTAKLKDNLVYWAKQGYLLEETYKAYFNGYLRQDVYCKNVSAIYDINGNKIFDFRNVRLCNRIRV